MKTLLSDKEIYKIHKGDNHSARTRMKIGDTIFKKGKFYTCVDKIVFKIDTCPHCKSHNTYHRRVLHEKNFSGNVYKGYTEESKGELLFHKIDYCLDCHKEFSIEMFCYKKVGLFSLIPDKYYMYVTIAFVTLTFLLGMLYVITV